MRSLLKGALAVFTLVLLMIAGVFVWFLFYTANLPDVGHLAQFAPSTTSIVFDECLSSPSTVVPAAQIGKELRSAIEVAEPGGMRSVQVARSFLCGSRIRNPLRYNLDQYRLIVRLRWQFSKDQIFTIYANRVYLADGVFGVEDASRHFFGRNAAQLSIAEAALLAGMIRAPRALSPYKHAESALRRRNQVIEAMKVQGMLSPEEATKAQAEPLGVLPSGTK